MDDDIRGFIGGGFLGILAGLLIGFTGGVHFLRCQAIENNAAEWRVNAKTGDTDLVWLTQKDTDQ